MADVEGHLSALVEALNTSSQASHRTTDKQAQQQADTAEADALYLLGKLAQSAPPPSPDPPIELDAPLHPASGADEPTNTRSAKFHKRAALTVILSGVVALAAIGVWWIGYSFGGPQAFRDWMARQASHKSDHELAKESMAKCDADAAKQPDDLYALVIPLKPAAADAPAPSGVSFGSLVLLPSSEALAALEKRTLVVDHRRYTLSIRDTAPQTIFSWDSAEGIFQFSKNDVASLTTPAFGLSIEGGAASWGARFQRQRGVCYWIQVLVRDR